MYISKATVENFRLLKSCTLDLRKELSLLIGRNNTGKTSLLVLFEKFYKDQKFEYTDFSVSLRDQIHAFGDATDIHDLSIRLVLEIHYDDTDNLEHLSEFILDLDPEIRTVSVLFECQVDKTSLLKELTGVEAVDKKDMIIKVIGRHLIRRVYVFPTGSYDGSPGVFKAHREQLTKKDLKDIRALINLQIIHARRDVASSEESSGGKKPLSGIATAYFNNAHDAPTDDLIQINKLLVDLDGKLGAKYDDFFKGFLKNSKQFLDLEKLNVVSNIQAKMLFDNSSQVVYGSNDTQLPEQLNGLGYLNILYLLLMIEIKKANFDQQKKDINLLFIEEPEAHTHPQMQYLFATEIQSVLKGIERLQSVITSHSAHIVSQSDFEDIRYMKALNGKNVEIKNFYTEMETKYASEPEQFQFLKQYLNIQSAELFFASKIIFIEGITERILLPYFINLFDVSQKETVDYLPIASQNISILEVGANAKAFAPFLELLDIKTLIITDIDTINTENGRRAAPVDAAGSNATSNSTLRHFFNAPKEGSDGYEEWFTSLRGHSVECASNNIAVTYQDKEDGYHARSFEDAFIKSNFESVKANVDRLVGLQNADKFGETNPDIYELTQNVLAKKSNFASSLLYLALSDNEVHWTAPSYIESGLKWIQSK